MCTRFVYNGNDTITGFNFDIDLSGLDTYRYQRKRPVLYRNKNA